MPQIPHWPLSFLVVGASHRSSRHAVRERLVMEETEVPLFLGRLVAAGLSQAMVLSTSERVEVFTLDEKPEQGARAITRALADQAGLPPEELAGQLYVLQDDEAVRHIFAVTAALDSLVIGEPQILSQIQACRRIARENAMLGPELESVLQAAIRTAEYIRAETGLAGRPSSIASAAVQVAGDIQGDLASCAGLVLGPGDMGELLAEQLVEAGLGRLVMTGRSATRLEQASRRFKCEVIPIDSLEQALEGADIVVASVGISGHLITAPMMEAALKRRRRKPVFLIDAATPGDIELSVGDLDGAFLYDLNDLERVVMDGRVAREEAVGAAWEILEAEVGAYLEGAGGLRAPGAVEALRRHLEALRDEVLAGVGAADGESATRALVDRLLQESERALEDMPEEEDGGGRKEAEALLLRLFGLAGGGAEAAGRLGSVGNPDDEGP